MRFGRLAIIPSRYTMPVISRNPPADLCLQPVTQRLIRKTQLASVGFRTVRAMIPNRPHRRLAPTSYFV